MDKQGKRAEARDLLAPSFGWFTEGLDTPVIKDAKALLEDLASIEDVARTFSRSDREAGRQLLDQLFFGAGLWGLPVVREITPPEGDVGFSSLTQVVTASGEAKLCSAAISLVRCKYDALYGLRPLAGGIPASRETSWSTA